MTVALNFYAHFVASAVGATGLTVTVDLDSVAKSDGSRGAVVTGGAAVEGIDGYYHYRYATADLDTYDYIAVFKTTGTADQKQIPSLWANYGIGNSAAIAGILSTAVPAAYSAGTVGYIVGNIASEAQLVSDLSSALRTVTITSPAGVNSSLTLNVGDDYKAADSRSIDVASASFPSLTGATITFRARMSTDPAGLTFTGSVVNSTTARIELTAAQTASIGRGRGHYDLRAALVTSADVVTLQSGVLVMNTI